eukprot:1358315-Pyramimonas_sp.AAC.1
MPAELSQTWQRQSHGPRREMREWDWGFRREHRNGRRGRRRRMRRRSTALVLDISGSYLFMRGARTVHQSVGADLTLISRTEFGIRGVRLIHGFCPSGEVSTGGSIARAIFPVFLIMPAGVELASAGGSR